MKDILKGLTDGQKLKAGDEEVVVKLHTIGDLLLTSGELVACDPLILDNAVPFMGKIPPGSYPVIVSIVTLKSGGERIAYAFLKISGGIPVRCEPALSEGVEKPREGEIVGYGVDTGTGCFMDKDAAHFFVDNEEFSNRIIDMNMWENITVDPGSKLNVIVFSTGWGDGVYATYYGYDKNNALCGVVTDFRVVSE